MMLPTHALAGMVVGLAVATVAPEHAGAAIAAGLFGGVLPDLDMYAGHRRTLHYPVYYATAAGVALPVAAVVPTAATVTLATGLVAAATHCVADVFGGGLELRPWEATSDRAVYDHHRDRWLVPRRWIAYDGSPGDLALAVALSAPLLATLDGAPRWVVLGALAIAATYTAVRRVLPRVAVTVVGNVLDPVVPDSAMAHLPERYRTSDER
jgi:hypothetical protein